MDDSPREKCSTTNWRAELARSLDEHRLSARTLLAGHRERFKTLESELTSRIDSLLQALSEEKRQDSEHEQDIARRELLLAQRDTALAERLQELASRETQWSLGLRESQERQQACLDQVAARLAELDARKAELTDLECRLQIEQMAIARRTTELEQRSKQLDERQQKLEQSLEQAAQRQLALDGSREKLRDDSEQLKQQFDQVKLDQANLDRERSALADRELETQRQRRHIAQQLRARKNELVSEVELHRAEALRSSHGEELQLQIRLSELQAKYDRAKEELAQGEVEQGSLGERAATLQQQLQSRDEELRLLTAQADAAELARLEALERAETIAAQLAASTAAGEQDRARLETELGASFAQKQTQLADQLDEAREQHARLLVELEQARAEAELARSAAEQAAASQLLEVDLNGEIARLQEENQRLQMQCAESQAGSGNLPAEASEELEDLRNRLELAVQDIRELKSKNADLQTELSKARKAAPASGASAMDAGLGWEAQKQRLLQQLEDFDEADDEQQAERLKIEQAIRVTDQMVAEKQQEIEELRQLLQNQSDNIGNVAVGAAAIASMLDSDELIRQERENVKELQQELEAKLRKAEVDISVERAKLARERAELEEKLQGLERERSQLAAAYGEGGDSTTKSSKPPARGRWLARLGIQGDEGKS